MPKYFGIHRHRVMAALGVAIFCVALICLLYFGIHTNTNPATAVQSAPLSDHAETLKRPGSENTHVLEIASSANQNEVRISWDKIKNSKAADSLYRRNIRNLITSQFDYFFKKYNVSSEVRARMINSLTDTRTALNDLSVIRKSTGLPPLTKLEATDAIRRMETEIFSELRASIGDQLVDDLVAYQTKLPARESLQRVFTELSYTTPAPTSDQLDALVDLQFSILSSTGGFISGVSRDNLIKLRLQYNNLVEQSSAILNADQVKTLTKHFDSALLEYQNRLEFAEKLIDNDKNNSP